jgi:lipoate-protein ligase B
MYTENASFTENAEASCAPPSQSCNVLRLGLTDYGKCLDIQRLLLLKRQQSLVCDTLIVTEHNPVITFGRNFSGPLPALPVPVFSIERGGEGTYHSPGQLVAYPIINLNENLVGIRTLVKRIQQAAVSALAAAGISAEGRLDPVGVWVGNRKIASIGIAVKRWVSFHGIAININNELSGFELIKPCGLDPSVMTSASRLLGHDADFGAVREAFIRVFLKEFNFVERTADAGLLNEADAEI